ncbi:hypothetical protein [Deinococcus multiflagellatus]|uniref:Uncharacterized protein n=1 Tax=Deinococcus multiflagellatus TaxID=1656887 RepID=A0ABW1ZT98_9DEIO|nr:hypothetical protein [Deinococcus multiflagellatus]MBZ9714453.1 hypothetical protein [Deinococcus multiflagellatus]
MQLHRDDQHLDIKIKRYASGDLAILLEAQGEPWAVASMSLPGLAPDEVAIKDYSENEGMLSDLLAAGVVEQPHRHLAAGFVQAPVCRLTAAARAAQANG